MGAQPDALTLAPDGNVWFNDQQSGAPGDRVA